MILWHLCPRDHHERVALQERPEAGRWYPEVDILPSMNIKRLPALDTEPNSTIDMCDLRFCPARPEETILVEDDDALTSTTY